MGNCINGKSKIEPGASSSILGITARRNKLISNKDFKHLKKINSKDELYDFKGTIGRGRL